MKEEKDLLLLSIARNAVDTYIEEDYKSKISFCEENNINLKLFDKFIKIVKTYDQDLYEAYRQRIDSQQEIILKENVFQKIKNV